MKYSSDKINQTVVAEKYCPTLSDEYTNRFQLLIKRLQSTLQINRIRIIQEEISEALKERNEFNELECNRYIASLSVLVDLSQQGWIFDIQDGELTLNMENNNVDEKEKIRYRLSAERNAQFKNESVAKFIRYMETERLFKNHIISITCLIGDKDILINTIRNNQAICEPYIQLVTNERDEYTGYKLSDIWRYFRYTWSIPYKTMPGRNLYYLVRDRLQPYHPIIGIFALGNTVLNLTVRDNDIGWTVEAIKENMLPKKNVTYCEQTIKGTNGKKITVKISKPAETTDEYIKRKTEYANTLLPLLMSNIDEAISDIYVKDLGYHRQTRYPRQEQIDALNALATEFAEKSINNKNNEKSPNWKQEAQSNLFKRKRATELAKLLSAKLTFNSITGIDNVEKLSMLLSNDRGRKAIHTALIANRKCKIGSNMMDIIVCGAIPPYNELLGGKLVSILACSPTVIRDYTYRYVNQVSEIASRMKGEKVIRDSRLVYLGTTSLYAVGSSQYNRIKLQLDNGRKLEYRRMGITEGFGTVYFSKATTTMFSKILESQDGGKRINNVFGEGTSPRFRTISRGLSSIGIRADAFLKHYSPRIVYSIDLAKNTKEYLMGYTNEVDYGFNLDNEDEVELKTQELINYWYNHWLIRRLDNVDIVQRLDSFRVDNFLLGNI